MNSIKHSILHYCLITAVLCGAQLQCPLAAEEPTARDKSLNVLFIGNSYTARHNLSDVVRQLAEAGDSSLTFHPTTVIYGGRRLIDHWQMGTQNVVESHSLTRATVAKTIADMKAALQKKPDDRNLKAAVKRHESMLKDFDQLQREKWDVVVLQSYRDDIGDNSLYVQYAPKFAELAKAQGARVVLYETTPTTQNAQPLAAAPDRGPVVSKTKSIAALANRINAKVAPMALVGHRCQMQRPDLTLRFVNDGHLNQTMAYLSACAIYSALFNKSPEGLTPNTVTDIRFWETDNGNFDRTKDRDEKPITMTLSDKDRLQLQKIAWDGYLEFESTRLSQ